METARTIGSGVRYSITKEGPTMELPCTYLEQTLTLLEPLCASKGTVGTRHVQSAIGKAARIGYVLLEISPFI